MTQSGTLPPLPTSGSATILLVEDHSSTQTLFSYSLKEQGFSVLTASSVQEALQACKQHPGPIHLLLMDILLPNTSELQLKKDAQKESKSGGLQLLRQVTALRPEIRVILMSGHSDKTLETLGVFKEQRPLLRKPFGVDTLLKSVHQVLENPVTR